MRVVDVKRSAASAMLALGILSSGLAVALPSAVAAPGDQWAPHPASTVLYNRRFTVASTPPGGNVVWSSEYQAQRARCESAAVKMGYLRGELHLTSGAYPASFPATAVADCLGFRENAIPE